MNDAELDLQLYNAIQAAYDDLIQTTSGALEDSLGRVLLLLQQRLESNVRKFPGRRTFTDTASYVKEYHAINQHIYKGIP